MKRKTHNLGRRCRSGVTLIETVLSLLILAGAFASALTAIGTARASQLAAADRRFALTLAEDLMAEVLAEPNYKEGTTFGHEIGESVRPRSTFDDVDDYDDWARNPPEDRYGNPVPGATGYTRRVQVMYVDPDNPARQVATDQGMVRILVRVRYNKRTVAMLYAYRSDVWQAPEENY